MVKVVDVVIATLLLFCVVFYFLHDSSSTNEENVDIAETKEYQIKLYPYFWTKRKPALEHFYRFIENRTQINFYEKLQKSFRLQAKVDIGDCMLGKKSTIPEIRLRHFITGKDKGAFTIDAKLRVSNLYRLTTKDTIRPPLSLHNISTQKYEEDIHPCKSHFSRETKLKVTNTIMDDSLIHSFKKCEDVFHYFPDLSQTFAARLLQKKNKKEAKGKFVDENQLIDEMEVKPKGWLSYTNEGYFENGVRYKFDLTLQYSNISELVYSDIAPKKGEFSMRIWANNNGLGAFDLSTVNLMNDLYYAIINEYGSLEDYPCSFPGVEIGNKAELTKSTILDHLPPPEFGVDTEELMKEFDAFSAFKFSVSEGDDDEEEDVKFQWSFYSIQDYLHLLEHEDYF